MIIEYDHNPNITNEQRLQSLKESVQMALNDVETRMQSISSSDEEVKVFVASINGTSFATVEKALKEGKLVFAATSNSVGTFNLYPYAHQNATSIVFTRNQYAVYGGNVTPQIKFVLLKNDDTWETITSTIADFVIEQGTDNDWTYRKWNSGIFEAWRYYQATGMSITSSSAGTYYGGQKNIPLPSFTLTISNSTYGNTTSQGSGIYIYNTQPVTGNNLSIAYRAHASATNASCGGYFHIIGTWK